MAMAMATATDDSECRVFVYHAVINNHYRYDTRGLVMSQNTQQFRPGGHFQKLLPKTTVDHIEAVTSVAGPLAIQLKLAATTRIFGSRISSESQ